MSTKATLQREERERRYEEIRNEVMGMAKVKETECKAALHGEETPPLIIVGDGGTTSTTSPSYIRETADVVNRPAHYRGKTMECIDVINDFDLNYHLGNALKYILRANRKGDKITDLKKAIWYLQRECGE